MLSAKTTNGKRIVLDRPERTNAAQETLRRKGPFYCPTCSASVVLKTGRIKSWHFAHRPDAPCLIGGEPETEEHLSGKSQLFQWLRRQLLQPHMEHYLPKIEQRPDLFLADSNPPTAFEFQCSNIPTDALINRTLGYHTMKVKPLWLFSDRRLAQPGRHTFKIKSAEQTVFSFQNAAPNGLFLSYFSPGTKLFVILNHIVPLTSSQFYAQIAYRNINQTPLERLTNPLTPPIDVKSFLQTLLSLKSRWRTEQRRPKTKAFNTLWKICTVTGRSFYAFPGYVGIPAARYMAIHEPPHQWQAWVVLKFVLNRYGSEITVKGVQDAFQLMLRRQTFRLRAGFREDDARQAVAHFLQLMHRLGILKSMQHGRYKVIMNEQWFNLTYEEAYANDVQICERLKPSMGMLFF